MFTENFNNKPHWSKNSEARHENDTDNVAIKIRLPVLITILTFSRPSTIFILYIITFTSSIAVVLSYR